MSFPFFATKRMQPLPTVQLALWALAVAGGGALIWFGFWRIHIKRLEEVRPGVLLRSAQPTAFGFRTLKARGVKTVVSLRMDDPNLNFGPLGLRENGPSESELLAGLELRAVQWPMGHEATWPWLSAWQFEEFHRFFDEPANFPAAIHCVGGRHRSGTIAALYRMEYDRWPAERAVREMWAYSYEVYTLIQDLNLRTYLPRPRPTVSEFAALRRRYSDMAPPARDESYEGWLKRLLASADASAVRARLKDSLERREPFALELAARVVTSPDDPAAALVAAAAEREIWDKARGNSAASQPDNRSSQWALAAALIADLGSGEQQARLLDLLRSEPQGGRPSLLYEACVAGVTNRYTENRIPYLRPLLDDTRPRRLPGAGGYTYRDTAVARLSAIINCELTLPTESVAFAHRWKAGYEHALAWFDAHPESLALRKLVEARPLDLPAGARSDYDGPPR